MNSNRTYTLIFIAVLLGTVLAAEGRKERSSEILIIGSTSIIGDIVGNVVGDKAELVSLMAPSQDPHAYEPTPKDMTVVENADVLFLNGYDLEEGLISVLETVGTGRIVELSRNGHAFEDEEHGEHEEHEEDGEHHHGGINPHTWMSPLLVVEWVEIIKDVLIETDPDNAAFYTENASSYTKELLLLHQDIQDRIGEIPLEDRILVTDHDALGYYAEEYGLKIIGTIIPGASTSSDASARHLAELIHTIEEQNVRAIFIGQTSGEDIRQLSDAIRKELGSPIRILPLLTGSIQKPGEPGDSYLNYMRYNTDQIVTGLSLE